jgi:selenocysteine lyase/cysteine desulfurase
MRNNEMNPVYLRQQIVGVDSTFKTPFGERLMVYCDYTASGRCLGFVEAYLQSLQRVYANTHTEDDITGRSMSQLLHEAEDSIKQSVNAGPSGRIIACGTGATGAIEKLQQIIGVALAPATLKNLEAALEGPLSQANRGPLMETLHDSRPVVFIGPYEHHSNELSWRQSLAESIEVNLDADGNVDMGHLEELLKDSRYKDRQRIGSFSAASNVTGMRSDVRRIASLLHKYGAMACFDFAACAPYVEIDMNPEPESEGDDPSIDAIFISPHKFIGGPGSSGVLVFNERIYHRELPPSVSAGGTVDYVGVKEQDFISQIEAREKAGTPGVLQTLKAGLVFQIKDSIGVDYITEREHELTHRAMCSWGEDENIELLGNPNSNSRVGIISFNIKDDGGRYLHHKFLTVLLNDLFGIQSRAGCSCAGPYGHRLLDIDEARSERYRAAVKQGYCGMKPGWCRIGLHWVMDDIEAQYVIDAVHFVAAEGHQFLRLYDFDLPTGNWKHKSAFAELPQFSLEAALGSSSGGLSQLSPALRQQLYEQHMREARDLARQLREEPEPCCTSLVGELGELQFFTMPESGQPLTGS